MLNKNVDKITGEVTYYTKHESGLEIYIMPRKDYTSSYAIFGTKYGSVHSDFVVPGESEVTHVPDGIAHYLEHKMFDQPDGSNVFDKFSSSVQMQTHLLHLIRLHIFSVQQIISLKACQF